MRPHILMTDPTHFEVCYRINPWMDPGDWRDPPGCDAAWQGFRALKAALEAAGAEVEVLSGREGLPDMVFPANAGVVLDGKAVVARFRHPERQGEEPHFTAAFEALRARGAVAEVIHLPEGVGHEGAGDAHWDAARGLLWVGFGPRSDRAAAPFLAETFGVEAVALELASDRFYHLDTCLCPLSGGEVLYFPDAFTPEALAEIRRRVPPHLRLEASEADAAALCVNAVCIDRTLVMARAPDDLRARLVGRGYRVVEVDLAPFIRSGGAAFCMTLRLDRRSAPALVPAE